MKDCKHIHIEFRNYNQLTPQPDATCADCGKVVNLAEWLSSWAERIDKLINEKRDGELPC